MKDQKDGLFKSASFNFSGKKKIDLSFDMILILKNNKVKGILKLIWFFNFGESDFESEWILRDFVLLDDDVKNFRNFEMRNFDEDDEENFMFTSFHFYISVKFCFFL